MNKLLGLNFWCLEQGLIDEVKDKITEDLKPADVDMAVKIYNNLKFKSNIPTEVIEYVDKTLIQVSYLQ
jgi:hypothetical protein